MPEPQAQKSQNRIWYMALSHLPGNSFVAAGESNVANAMDTVSTVQ